MLRLLRIAVPIALALVLSASGWAQTAQPVLPGLLSTTGCPSVALTPCYLPYSVTNPLPVNASVSASISGFAPVTTGTPIAVTTGGVTGTLPAGTVVVASNVGTTNGAYCKLGASATTSDQLIPPNSWFAFTVAANTQLTCITSTSTTTVNTVGGSGLPTGSGGGGGGGGSGGSVTQGTTPWIVAGQGTAGSAATGVATIQGIASMTPVQVSQATASNLNATVGGTGSAGTAATGVVTVQGIASMTPVVVSATSLPLPTGAATSANQSPVAVTPVTASTALESNHVLKGSAGSLLGFQVNATSAAEWVMLFNATALPANGAVTPVAWWQVAANSTLSVGETPSLTLSTGITVGCSTTGPFTLTASTLCTFGAGAVQ